VSEFESFERPDPQEIEEAEIETTRYAPSLGDTVEHAQQIPSKDEAVRKANFVRASDLITDPEDLDTGDWEPGGRYKGFTVLGREDWPENHEAIHGNQRNRFYVQSVAGTIGLVPWDGSQIIWPWERAWAQDLHRTSVETFLKEEPKKKERK